jgi:uncharacterized protein
MTKAKPARHIPVRTCIGCRRTFAKRELVRLVCPPDGDVEVDLSGKKSGRGAYVCQSSSCWEAALASGRLEKAMRTSIKAESRDGLVKYARGLNNTGSQEGVS